MGVFGSNIAQNDSLLDECFVPINVYTESASVFTGRWGTGKTAILFHRTKKLREALKNSNHKNLCYIGEDSLNINSLIEVNNTFKDDYKQRQKAFEEIWCAEITRVFCLLLTTLKSSYGNVSGKHWDFVFRLAEKDALRYSLWSNLSLAMKTIFKSRSDDISAIQHNIEDIFNDYTLSQVFACLEDVKEHTLRPIVTIEPLDSPNSALDQDSHLAQDVVTALVETFIRHFTPMSDEKPNVLIAIPWHRIKEEDYIFPQRLPEYLHYLSWNHEDLRSFINSRIEYEFRRVGRSHTKGVIDGWRKLFEDTIRSDYYRYPYPETSFSYMVRHTNYRARDILRLSRNGLKAAALKLNISEDEILSSRGSYKVEGKVFRDSINQVLPQIFKERKIEAARRYPDVLDFLKMLRGVEVPFSLVELNRRFKTSEYELDHVIKVLWYSGFLGLQLYPKNNEMIEMLTQTLQGGRTAYREYNVQGRHKTERFYLFEYNISWDPIDIIYKYQGEKQISINLVLHPVMYYGTPYTISRETPIGA